MEFEKVGRRTFLTNSAMAMLGYSACVALPSGCASAGRTSTNEAKKVSFKLPKPMGQPAYKSEIGKRINAVVNGNKIKFENIGNYSPASEKFMSTHAIDCDLLVAGGGLSGISVALAAARNGAKVVLVHNRSRLGGNSSSEIKMHPLGIFEHRAGYREAGIIEELRLEDISTNSQRSWEMWDLMLYDKIISEPNITLLLDTTVFSVEISGRNISCVYARSDLTLKIFKITAKNYADCTGDGRLAMEAGAEMMWGREGSGKYGESLAADYNLRGTLCSSVLFTTVNTGKPTPYKAPSWAHKITADDLKMRDPKRIGFTYGYYFVSHGGMADTVRDDEVIRFELLAVILGLWDYIKNCGKYPEVENLALDTVGMIPARRESYRIKGLGVFTQADIYGDWRKYPDQVAACGWKPEDQTSGGIFARNEAPVMHSPTPDVYNMPLRIMVSKDFDNLCMAGRNMSCSHLAFSCTRVMCTGAVMGQALGTAVALAIKTGRKLSDFTSDGELIKSLQQTLLRDGHLILDVPNEDVNDIAKLANVTATSSANGTVPASVVNGKFYDVKKSDANKWMASMSGNPEINFAWNRPTKISKAIFNFDSGRRHLTITKEASRRKHVLEAPQPEVLKDFDVVATLPNGEKKVVGQVRGNYQKRVVVDFPRVSVKSLTIKPIATNGDKFARIFEVRIYA